MEITLRTVEIYVQEIHVCKHHGICVCLCMCVGCLACKSDIFQYKKDGKLFILGVRINHYER